jgi:hypothetical protein
VSWLLAIALGVGAVGSGTIPVASGGSPVSSTGRLPAVVVPKAVHPRLPVTQARVVKLRASSSPRRWTFVHASAYGIGDGFLGGHMACGGRLDAVHLTVAHKTLPCGTRVQLTYRGRTIVAKVTDRGPYWGNRVFDLGPAVCRALRACGIPVIGWRLAS